MNREYKNVEKKARLFYNLNDKEKISLLKIDVESIHYITPKNCAARISHLISIYLHKLHINNTKIFITDATAGVGGNTISFAHIFDHVNAIEIDKLRYYYLKNNLQIYNLKNVDTYCGDCITVLPRIKNQQVVFVDPPWGGRNYKKYENLRLHISDISIETLCNTVLDKNKMECSPELLILKLPKNYDLTYFKSKIHSKIWKRYELEKMYIIVIINTNKICEQN